MKKPTCRSIRRAALLLDASGHPEAILKDLPEVAAKGYRAVSVFPLSGTKEEEVLQTLCRKASELGLSVWVLTCYMKYQEKYLADHPEQKMVMAKDFADQDGLSTSNWGCPFNPDFKARHFAFLRQIAAIPAVSRISLNDEAFLLSGCYCRTCREDYSREIGGEMPLKVDPKEEDWRDEKWRRFLKWRMDRWNHVHGEMVQQIHEANPRVQVVFQASPASDLWLNPWFTGVDLAGMVQSLDGLSTDPYYTFHDRHFSPAEVYLSEWCRFLEGIVPEGKETEIIVQGFSHPTFTRPLGREDGLWSALIPPACGINQITPYTYAFQKCSPVQETYEQCFKFDRYFEQARPLKYAAIVHGAQTEIYCHPLPMSVPSSYDGTRVMPVADCLRHRGIPYGYLPDIRLDDPASLHGYKVIILPEINALSPQQQASIRKYADQGGSLVILGALGSADELGTTRPVPFLEQSFGIRITSQTNQARQFRMVGRHPVLDALEMVDEEAARHYMEGAAMPLFALNHGMDAVLPSDAEVIAEFTDQYGHPTGKPAIASLGKSGRILWLAGFPSRTTPHPRFGTTVLNYAHRLIALLVEWAARSKPSLRVENWPPAVPIKELRPFDQRFTCTFEFFPLVGENLCLGVITSYFKEPASFTMVLDLPQGKHLRRVTELIGNHPAPFLEEGQKATIRVEMGFETPALMYLLELK